MPYTVFVSHASSDADYARNFVDFILKLGCDIPDEEIFFSSDLETGIATGEDLMATIRAEVGEATLVIALVTPTYQTRPTCIAELGAAWSRAGTLFPLHSPGMKISDLSGVLPSVMIRSSDDGPALDELHEKLTSLTKNSVRTVTWNSNKQKWLAWLRRSEPLEIPPVVSMEDHAALRLELEGTQDALADNLNEIAELKAKIDQLKELKDATEVAEVLFPTDEYEQLLAYASSANTAMQPLTRCVREALFLYIRGESLLYPSLYDDPDGHECVGEALQRQLLEEVDEGQLVPNSEKPSVARSIEALEELQEFIRSTTRSTSLIERFTEEHDCNFDLKDRDCWEALKLK